MEKAKRVLVGMSGGVDSSAVCLLLQEQGYEPVGLTLRIWDTKAVRAQPDADPPHIAGARDLARRIGMEHHVLDVRESFRQIVVQNFLDQYLAGFTPNPCVLCNLFFKWHYLLQEADRLGCGYVATGHYARIEQDEKGRYYIAKGVDERKDQSYFLWRLGPDELARTLFPLGDRTKPEVKAYVRDRGFGEKAGQKESMEACFVEDDYRTFLREQVPDLEKRVEKGLFVDRQGKTVGRHEGLPFYTVGQRKGLGVALGYPAFVVRIHPGKNTIRLGTRDELAATEVLVESVRTPDPEELAVATDLTVRIRYRSEGVRARFRPLEDGRGLLTFETPVSAVTPGQSAVFYRGDRLVGGALIADQSRRRKLPDE